MVGSFKHHTHSSFRSEGDTMLGFHGNLQWEQGPILTSLYTMSHVIYAHLRNRHTVYSIFNIQYSIECSRYGEEQAEEMED